MFSKNLEFAIQQLQKINSTDGSNVPPPTFNGTNVTIPEITSADISAAVIWAQNIAAFIYLGGGIAFTFFGAKLVQLLISGLAGLLFCAIPLYFAQNIFGAIGALIVFGIVAHQVYHKDRFHAVVLGIAVGSYIGSLAWIIFFSHFTTVYIKYVMQLAGAFIFGFLGHQHKDKHGHADYKERSA